MIARVLLRDGIIINNSERISKTRYQFSVTAIVILRDSAKVKQRGIK